MSRKSSLAALPAVLLPMAISGCGLTTPMLEYGEDIPENHVTGAIVNEIVDHVKCELGRAILYEINYDRANAAENHIPRNFSWLDTAAGTLTLTMSVNEKSGFAPGATWTDPLPTVGKASQSFTLGLGASAAAEATRKQQVDFVFDVKKDFLDNKASSTFKDTGLTPARCQSEDGKTQIEGDLRILAWLDSALFARNIPGNVDLGPPDVLSDDVTFVVTFTGSATPSWKLVRWSIDPSGSLASATRVRTNEALIVLGKTGGKGKAGASSGPTQSVIEFRNITMIGSALNFSLKSQ